MKDSKNHISMVFRICIEHYSTILTWLDPLGADCITKEQVETNHRFEVPPKRVLYKKILKQKHKHCKSSFWITKQNFLGTKNHVLHQFKK